MLYTQYYARRRHRVVKQVNIFSCYLLCEVRSYLNFVGFQLLLNWWLHPKLLCFLPQKHWSFWFLFLFFFVFFFLLFIHLRDTDRQRQHKQAERQRDRWSGSLMWARSQDLEIMIWAIQASLFFVFWKWYNLIMGCSTTTLTLFNNNHEFRTL